MPGDSWWPTRSLGSFPSATRLLTVTSLFGFLSLQPQVCILRQRDAQMHAISSLPSLSYLS
jgi:hypothetical protein